MGGGNSNKNLNNKKTINVPSSARASSMSLDYSTNSNGGTGIKKYGGNLLRKEHRNKSTTNIKIMDLSHNNSYSSRKGNSFSGMNSSRSTVR